MNGQMATIRRDGATCLFVYGQKVIELTGRGVMTCDVNGENATTIANGSFEAASIANGVLYLGGAGRVYAERELINEARHPAREGTRHIRHPSSTRRKRPLRRKRIPPAGRQGRNCIADRRTLRGYPA